LTSPAERVKVNIKYKDVEKTLSGGPEEVWILTNKFFSQFLPSFKIANKLVLSVDLQELVKDCENIIAFTQEGPYLLVPRNRLTDNETLSLLLLANYLGRQLNKSKKDGVSKEELQMKLGKNAKIASTRLGELVKSEIATRTPEDIYRITTFGIAQMQKDTLPRIKAKIGN
jgi:hypothetical protein